MLENTRTGRKKEIACDHYVKVWYMSSQKRKVHQGFYRYKDREPLTYFGRVRVIDITDSSVRCTAIRPTFRGVRRDRFTVALDRLMAIQRCYRNGRRFTSVGFNAIGTVAPLLLDPSGGLIFLPILLWTMGTMEADAASDRLVYPLRKINHEKARWRVRVD